MSDINSDLRKILADAIAACVSGAIGAETCAHAQNPAWMSVTDALDECTDILREIEVELS